CHQYTGSPPTF
nr:immunoglobulin light chain junction region [Macaca mulatta]MOV34656.1 immunoglobulin light chain junction region [Macaca mulatta]MOV34812.1 immunoglobulin light chain junction region [Macaca mulatta]MOV34861.1 immunoglobulin light chain junction region [Macaca mulatta]